SRIDINFRIQSLNYLGRIFGEISAATHLSLHEPRFLHDKQSIANLLTRSIVVLCQLPFVWKLRARYEVALTNRLHQISMNLAGGFSRLADLQSGYYGSIAHSPSVSLIAPII